MRRLRAILVVWWVGAAAAGLGGGCSGGSTPRANPYPERYRPQLHFSPAKNWMNDPTGLVWFRGEYHLFYQHDPSRPLWFEIHWGHAVSRDLVHWRHLPVALSPDEALGLPYSGSAVVDEDNTSGLCTPSGAGGCLILVFTHHGGDDGTEKQSLAYSNDEGRSWTLYPGNPVLANRGSADFRDPKVFWDAARGRWVMVVAAGKKVELFASPDLIHWTYLSAFGPAGATGGTWECPDLFELPVSGTGDSRWVLNVDLNPGGPQGGSGSQYFVGQFDGTTFATTQTDTRWVDAGKDFYASQSWSNVRDGRRIWAAWMSNWLYATLTPTAPWRGALTFPRELALARDASGEYLTQAPIREVEQLREQLLVSASDVVVDGPSPVLDGVSGTLLDIRAVFAVGSAAEVGLRVRMSPAGGAASPEQTVIGWSASDRSVFVDRRQSGFPAGSNFAERHAAPLEPTGGVVDLRILVDWSSVEVFAGGGRVVLTDLVFPAPTSDKLAVYASGAAATLSSLEVWRLGSQYLVP